MHKNNKNFNKPWKDNYDFQNLRKHGLEENKQSHEDNRISKQTHRTHKRTKRLRTQTWSTLKFTNPQKNQCKKQKELTCFQMLYRTIGIIFWQSIAEKQKIGQSSNPKTRQSANKTIKEWNQNKTIDENRKENKTTNENDPKTKCPMKVWPQNEMSERRTMPKQNVRRKYQNKTTDVSTNHSRHFLLILSSYSFALGLMERNPY